MAAFTLSEMLDRTNTRANRDLDQAELYSLEALIDVAGIEAVLQGLSEICGLKAEHIAQAWQDTPLAKRWATLEHWVWRLPRQQGCRPRITSEAAYGLSAHAASNPNHPEVTENG